MPPRNENQYLMSNHDLEEDHPDDPPIKLSISYFHQEI